MVFDSGELVLALLILMSVFMLGAIFNPEIFFGLTNGAVGPTDGFNVWEAFRASDLNVPARFWVEDLFEKNIPLLLWVKYKPDNPERGKLIKKLLMVISP